MEIIIAIVGLFYLGVKLLSEKQQSKVIDAELKQESERRRYFSERLLITVDEIYDNHLHVLETEKELNERFKKEIEYIYGRENARASIEVLEWLTLAERGKFLSSCGIKTYYGDSVPIRIRLAETVEKLIRKNGINVTLVLNPVCGETTRRLENRDIRPDAWVIGKYDWNMIRLW